MDSRLENRWANDIDGSALAAQPGKSQGRPLKSSGSNTHRPETAYPTCVLPRGPYPSQPNLRRPPDVRSPLKKQFHAPTSASLWAESSPQGLARILARDTPETTKPCS